MMDPCAADTSCLAAPAEFVRLRYFFGQRLGVIDLADAQSYLVGKQRFHNLRAHGAGVLCGLGAERYMFPQGSSPTRPTTLLRVRRGAALDACGREIVVGWDQCIDVAAWYAQHPGVHIQPDGNATTVSLRLWVALCYRECPSDPAPAPRDPCGCDAGGCEYARIREGFELKLVTDEEAKLLAPGKADLLNDNIVAEEVLSGPIEDGVARMVARIVGASCPDPPVDPCLLLASVQATIDATRVIDISGPDNTIPERPSLLSTSVLQQELIRLLVAANGAGLVGSGPRFSAVTFADGTADAGKLSIGIDSTNGELSRDPTLAPAQVTVHVFRFLDDGSWSEAAPDSTAYFGAPSPRLELTWSTGLVDSGRYRALIESDRAQPPVDTMMRPLTPSSWARHFRLVKNVDGNLVLADALF